MPPLLSICIPTYKRPEILRNTLNSIYSQDVDHSLFEVCISDDSPTDETEQIVETEFKGIDNLVYKHILDCGYINMIYAVRMGSGLLLKASNDYSTWNDGTLAKMIARVRQYQSEKPLLWFGQKTIKDEEELLEFQDYECFIKKIDIMCTWVGAFSIWKEDIDKYDAEGLKLCEAFPHTSYLFRMAGKKCIVDNYCYVNNQPLKTKGGYNLPEYFVQEYLGMVRQDLLLPGHIAADTYGALERQALKFTADWYWNIRLFDGYTFRFDNYKEIIERACGKNGYRTFEIFRGGYWPGKTARYLAGKMKKLLKRTSR